MNPDTWQQMKRVFHAALDLRPEEREAFLARECKGNKELLLQVVRLLRSHNDAGLFLVSPAMVEAGVALDDGGSRSAPEPERVGQRIGPYEIIREVGHGGMGTVFLAIRADDQYRKQVAIKLVNRGMDTDLILRRFMMERQILANLEHPNIARLLEGGSTLDGLPYFVMEYIEGEPITDYCDGQGFNTTERLELFRQVCSALQYAHQNLVVHRDIKPSNILVTSEGVPKLLDFGIAKLLSPGWAEETGEATASMVRLMTPEYASPEQFRGLAITTASDVYSLGVVLYELLSGHHPFRLTGRPSDELAQLSSREEPPKPSKAIAESGLRNAESTANSSADFGLRNAESKTNLKSEIRNPKSLRGDLDNIVLKALRKEPERRYASVQELSEDIRRHLHGLPVIASPDTFSYRTRKFVQRHRVGVVAAAVVVMALLVATAITTWQARVARRERDRAESRFNQVRKLANTVLFEYHDGIATLPGSTPIREKMVKDALEYLDNLSAENSSDLTLQRELADAYEKVGDVQGNPYQANLGNQEGALRSYRRALTIREAVYAANPANAATKLELSYCYSLIGDILWARGESEPALAHYRKALTYIMELAQADPKKLEYLRNANHTLNGIGNVQKQTGDFTGALETYRKFLANAEVLLAANTTDRDNQTNLAIANLKIGDAFMGNADPAGALTYYEKSVQELSELAGSQQNNATAPRLLSLGYQRVATALRSLNQYEKAASFNLKALEQQTSLAESDPKNLQIQFDIGSTYGNLSDNYLQMNRLDAAVKNSREAIRIFSENLAKNPGYSEARAELGAIYLTYAEVLLAKADTNGALETYRKSLSILEPEPIRSAQPIALAHVYEGLGNVQRLRADQVKRQTEQQTECLTEAKDWYRKSLDLWQSLEQQGKLSSNNKDTPREINQKMEQCDVALAKLKATR
jgi:serine/threonine protein kinase/tetratricopeptide (TPR) repeat protein